MYCSKLVPVLNACSFLALKLLRSSIAVHMASMIQISFLDPRLKPMTSLAVFMIVSLISIQSTSTLFFIVLLLLQNWETMNWSLVLLFFSLAMSKIGCYILFVEDFNLLPFSDQNRSMFLDKLSHPGMKMPIFFDSICDLSGLQFFRSVISTSQHEGDLHVPTWIFLCWKRPPPILNLLLLQ